MDETAFEIKRGEKWTGRILGLLALSAIPVAYLFWHRAPVTELTTLGRVLVTAAGIVAGFATLLFLSLKSVPGSNFEHLTYMRQTKHKRWLGVILLASAVLGIASSIYGRASMGQLARLLPAQEYSSFRARVIDRSHDEADPFTCEDGLEVEADDAIRHSLCLERGIWWPSTPDHLKKVRPGDFVIINVRRTVVGSAAEVAEIAVPGQDFYVE